MNHSFLLVYRQFKHNVKYVFNICRPDLHLKFYIFFSYTHFIFFFYKGMDTIQINEAEYT